MSGRPKPGSELVWMYRPSEIALPLRNESWIPLEKKYNYLVTNYTVVNTNRAVILLYISAIHYVSLNYD